MEEEEEKIIKPIATEKKEVVNLSVIREKKVENVKYITSRNREIVMFDGHAFYHNKGDYYMCSHKKDGCNVRAKKYGDNFVYTKCSEIEHNHPIDKNYE